MLNGDGNEMASRSIELISKKKKQICKCSSLFFLNKQRKKNKFVLAAPFFLIRQKAKFARDARLFFAVVLHDSTTMPFCTTKTSNFLVNQTLFSWRNCLCAYQRFCFLCSCYFLLLSFSLCWPPPFLIFSPPL